jgi:hypothetical protein
MSPRTQLILRSAVFGFVGGLVILVFFVNKVGAENWSLVFLQPFEVSVLFPLLSAVAAALVAARFDPFKVRWPQGVVLALYTFILFTVLQGVLNGVYVMLAEGSFWLGAATFIVTIFADVFFGTIIVGWIIVLLGSILGFTHSRRLNKSLNTDASDAGAG